MAAMMTTCRLGATVAAANTFSVRVFSEAEGLDATFEISDDEYVLDAAERQGIELPNSCRIGSCGTCVGRVVEGQVDQSELCGGLDEDQIAAGYILPCVAYPRSNLIIETHQEQNLY